MNMHLPSYKKGSLLFPAWPPLGLPVPQIPGHVPSFNSKSPNKLLMSSGFSASVFKFFLKTRPTAHLQIRLPVYYIKGCKSGTVWWKRYKGQDMGKGHRASKFSLSLRLSPSHHVSSTQEHLNSACPCRCLWRNEFYDVSECLCIWRWSQGYLLLHVGTSQVWWYVPTLEQLL